MLKAFFLFLLSSFPFQETASSPRSVKRLYQVTKDLQKHVQTFRDHLAQLERPDPGSHPRTRVREADDLSVLDADSNDSDEGPTEVISDEELDQGSYSLIETVEQQFTKKAFSLDQLKQGASLVRDLFIFLFKQSESQSFTSPLYAFLACYSIDYKKKCLRPPSAITQVYSALIYGAQLILVDYLEDSLSSTSSDPSESDFSDLLADHIYQYFQNDTKTIMGDILAHRAYAFALGRITSSLGDDVI